jgi:hypothetical protein
LLILASRPVAGQSPDAFLAAARSAAALYRDPAAALAAGYRPMGPESPAMGRHWVHPGLLFKGVIDPARPAILAYAMIAGRPSLAGVAYAVPPGGEIPAEPASRAAWHVHDGTLIEEAVQPDHDAHSAGASDAGRRGVAVLHAWVGVPNPAGVFAADNWALPYVRLGLEPPAGAPKAAAQGLALAGGGVPFFVAQLTWDAGLTPDRAAAVRRVLDAGADSVSGWLAARPARAVAAAELEWLARVWDDTWRAARREAAHGEEGAMRGR